MPPARSAITRAGMAMLAFAGSVAVVAALVRPFDAGPAATDAAASVLYFDRIVSGHRLEAYVNMTPKPMMTLIYGGLHGLTGDWRPAAWVMVLLVAAGIVMAAELVRRVAGREAAVFALVALLGSAAFVGQATTGHGVPVAFAMWSAAGLALVRPVPRYGIGGAVLLIGGLARPETFIILAIATGWLTWWSLRGPRPPRGAALLLVGWGAIVILGIHDLLLTGDPLWWTKVAAISAATQHAGSLGRAARLDIAFLLGQAWLLLGGAIGAIVLIRRRSWILFWGLAAIGPLVVVETLVLGARRLAVLGYYLLPVQLSATIATAIGIGWLLAVLRRHASDRWAATIPRGAAAIAVVTVLTAGLAAVALVPSHLARSADARSGIGGQAAIAQRLELVTPMLRAALGTVPRRPAVPPGPYATPVPADIVLFVPRYQMNRLAATLGVTESRIRWLEPGKIDLVAGYPPAGSIVYTDREFVPSTVTDATAILRPSTATVIDGVRVVPLVADPARGIWISRIEAASGNAAAP